MNQSNDDQKQWERTFEALDALDALARLDQLSNVSESVQLDALNISDWMSEEKIARCQTIFKQFDKDNNNRLSVSELGQVLQALGRTYNEGRLQNVIDLITGCSNSEGLSFEEFVTLLRNDLMDSPEHRLHNRFRIFDADNSGYITLQELQLCLGHINCRATNEELEAVLRRADTNNDGHIDYEEFYRLFQEIESQQRRLVCTSMPDRDWWEKLWPYPDETLKQLGLKEGMSVLDVGCGYGLFTIPAAILVNPAPVVGIDIDGEILEQGRQAGEGITNCSWIWGDLRTMSRMLSQTLDFVLIHSTLHGVDDKVKLVRDVESVLNPRGCFCVVNWCPIPREETMWLGKPRGPKQEVRMTPQQTILLVEEASVGLSYQKCISLPPYHYGLLFKRSRD